MNKDQDQLRDGAPPAFAYANPKVFYDGTFRYRNWTGCVMSAALTVSGVALVLGSQLAPVVTMPGAWGWWFELALGMLGVASLAGAAFTLVFMVQGREQPIRVTEDGIVQGRTLWSWERVARFGGQHYSRGIMVTFQLRGCDGARTVVSTPPLTRKQFAQLAQTVKTFAAVSQAHLIVVEEPATPDD